MGERIAKAAGLNLDDFDIPGRARAPKPAASRYRDDLFARTKAPPVYTPEELHDALRRYAEQMNRSAYASTMRSYEDALRGAGATATTTAYDAQRRAFHKAAAEAKARDRARDAHAKAKAAADELNKAGTPCYWDNHWHCWIVQFRGGVEGCTDGEVVELARIARERAAASAPKTGGYACPGGCGKTILFGDSCTDCERA